MSTIIQRGFVAVRKDSYDGRTWFDMATWSGQERITRGKAEYEERQNPGLKCGSPVQRIARVAVQEERPAAGKRFTMELKPGVMERLSRLLPEEE